MKRGLTATGILFLCVVSLFGENAKNSGITLLKPVMKSTVPLLREEHKKFWDTVSERKKLNKKQWKETQIIIRSKVDNCKPLEVEFAWECDFKAVKHILVLAGDGEVRHFCTGEKCSIKVNNLRIGTDYLWFVDAVKPDGNVERSEKGSFRTEDKPPRWINLPGISNVRDVGGWKTADGKMRIRQGIVYRGGEFDGHQNITAEGKIVIRDILRLRSDWDLRNYTESGKGMTGYPLKELNVHLINNPKKSSTPAGLAAEMHFLANLQEYPLYIHCWGGADRTGQVVFVLQALLGIADEDLLTDYEMTSFGRWGTRSRHNGLRPFLNQLDKYGKQGDSYAVKVENFLRAGGLPKTDIEFLRNFLLEKIR